MVEYAIGIDFGATNTRVGFREKNTKTTNLHRAPGIRIIDIKTVEEIAEQIVSLVVVASGRYRANIKNGTVVVGLPGIQMTDDTRRKAIKQATEEQFKQAEMEMTVIIVSNWRPLLYSLCGNGIGAATIVGSGNVSVYQYTDPTSGKLHYDRNGGWGTMFGDPASGIALAEFGLRQLCDDIENRRFSGAVSTLLMIAETTLGIHFADVSAVREFCQAHRAEAFCPTMLKAVKAGDETCKGILSGEINLLITQITRTFPATDDVSAIPYTIAGGLMEDEVYRGALLPLLRDRFPGLVINEETNAVHGAIKMAEAGLTD